MPLDPVDAWKQEIEQLWHLDPAEIAAKENKRCQNCDCLLIPGKKQYQLKTRYEPSKHLTWPDNCPACGKQLAVEIYTTQTDLDPVKVRSAALARLGIPAEMQSRTFEAYKDRQDMDTKEWLASVINWGNEFLDYSNGDKHTLQNKWLVLHGANGLGKTHLPVAMLMALFDAGYKDFRFIVWPEFCDRIRATFNPSTQEYEEAVKREAKDIGLVVLDDIDKVCLTEWAQNTLYLVLNYRINNGLPTVISLNWGPGDADPLAPGRLALAEILGKATYDRIMDNATAIEFTGESYRSGIAWNEYGEK